MSRSKSARSAYSDLSRDADDDANKQELVKVQQTIRVIEGEKKRCHYNFQLESRQQDKKIKLLHRENEELNKNIHLAESKQNQIKDADNSLLITAGQRRIDRLEAEMEEEKRKQNELDSQIRNFEKKNQNVRVKSATLSQRASRGTDATSDQKVNDIEGRLYRANSKYNSIIAQNGNLRTEIETYRVCHRNFEQSERKLDKKLKGLTKETQQVMEASSIAHEQREDAKTKHANQRERSEKELAQYNSDIKQLERLNENSFNLKVFMENKNQEREEKSHGLSQRTRQKRRDQEIMLQQCADNWEEIKAITGTHKISQMVEQFKETERENFALFNYINEVNNNIEHETDEISQIRAKFTSQSTTTLLNDEERELLLEKNSEELKYSQAQTDEVSAELDASNTEFEQLRSGIEAMAHQLSIDLKLENKSSLMDGLGSIEDRINELIAAKAVLVEEQDPDMLHTRTLLVPGPPPLPIEEHTGTFNAPSTGDAGHSEVADDLPISTIPLQLHELREKVKEKKNKELEKQQAASMSDMNKSHRKSTARLDHA